MGTVFLLYTYVRMLIGPLLQLTQELQNLQEASGSLLRIEELFNTPRCNYPEDGAAYLCAGALAIEVPTLCLPIGAPSAGDETGKRAKRRCTTSLCSYHQGRKLGLLGRTGSGKTTVTRLLLRLYEPQQGAIRLGNVDIRDLRLADLRHRIGIVTQDVQLFQASVLTHAV